MLGLMKVVTSYSILVGDRVTFCSFFVEVISTFDSVLRSYGGGGTKASTVSSVAVVCFLAAKQLIGVIKTQKLVNKVAIKYLFILFPPLEYEVS